MYIYIHKIMMQWVGLDRARRCGREGLGGCLRGVLIALALLEVSERELFIDNILVRIHLIIKMIWWAGLAP